MLVAVVLRAASSRSSASTVDSSAASGQDSAAVSRIEPGTASATSSSREP
jgi:hypothetical protein